MEIQELKDTRSEIKQMGKMMNTCQFRQTVNKIGEPETAGKYPIRSIERKNRKHRKQCNRYETQKGLTALSSRHVMAGHICN